MDGWANEGAVQPDGALSKKKYNKRTRLNESTRRVVIAADALAGIKTIILIGVPLAYMQPNPNEMGPLYPSLSGRAPLSVCRLCLSIVGCATKRLIKSFWLALPGILFLVFGIYFGF